MKKLLIASLVLSSMILRAQTPVSVSPKPDDSAYTVITHYTSGNPDFICKALSSQNGPNGLGNVISTVTSITNANPGVATTTGNHGIFLNGTATPKIIVYITGATSGWVTLNGLHVVTAASPTTFTLDIDTTSFGSFSGQTIVVYTRAPLTNLNIWSVASILYDASANPVYTGWAANSTPGSNGLPGPKPVGNPGQDLHGGETGFAFQCSAPTAAQ